MNLSVDVGEPYELLKAMAGELRDCADGLRRFPDSKDDIREAARIDACAAELDRIAETQYRIGGRL